MKKLVEVNLKPYGALFDEQIGRVLLNAENSGPLKLMFQKGGIKSLVCPEEDIKDCIPHEKKSPIVNIVYTFANEHQDEDLTLESIVGRTVDSVRVYYPNAGNSNLTVSLLMIVPPVKDENGKVIKPKRNDSPITLIITASFNPSKYIFE